MLFSNFVKLFAPCSNIDKIFGWICYNLQREEVQPNRGYEVFFADGTFCNKTEGAFVLEENVVYYGEGPFCNKGDAAFIIDGEISMTALMAILTTK